MAGEDNGRWEDNGKSERRNINKGCELCDASFEKEGTGSGLRGVVRDNEGSLIVE